MQHGGNHRGRPTGQMTQRRRQILELYMQAVEAGEGINYARMARQTGMFDYRKARRVVSDLKRIGAVQ